MKAGKIDDKAFMAIRLDNDLHERFGRSCKAINKTMTFVVREYVQRCVDKYEKSEVVLADKRRRIDLAKAQCQAKIDEINEE